MAKYKQYYREMIEKNKEIFDSFQKIHDQYALDQEKYQEKYNREGEKILEIIREWENRLCRRSQNAGYGHFAGSLADKFWQEVRSHFPFIDHIGLIIEPKEEFTIKKINLGL